MKFEKLKISTFCRLTLEKICDETGLLFQNTQNLELAEWLKFLYKELHINYPKFYKMDVMSKAALISAHLLENSHPFSGTNTPLVFANRTGSLASDLKHIELIKDGNFDHASPAVFVYTLPNIAMGEISIKHQLHSRNVFLIFEEFGNESLLDNIQFSFQKQGIHQVIGAWIEANENHLDVMMFLVNKSDTGLEFSRKKLEEIYTF